MHELSLAEEVIRIVTQEAEKHRVQGVAGVEIEVGALSGVEADSLEFCLGILSRDTLLEGSDIRVIRTPGDALQVRSFTPTPARESQSP